jgi:acetylornithine deacetylase/succinyl-diaminopimelate desuccinylase-like protein
MSHNLSFEELFTQSEQEFRECYFDFLRQKTISADPAFRKNLQQSAVWLESYLKDSGFSVELWNKDDAPVVVASHCKAGPKQPTLLIYNHYDVQPVDPLELWASDPFEPVQKGHDVFARGAQDNKGQCFYVLSALKTLIKQNGSLPINVKLCIEGEEESGSAALSTLLRDPQKRKALTADFLLVVDVGMKNATTPAITLGTRGLIAFTVEVEASNTDLHSGTMGGIVYNPLHALVEILSSLRERSGKIAIPGFYESLVIPSAEEIGSISFDFDPEELKRDFGAEATGGEKSFSPLERAWLRPTLEINGITGGYGGPGTKTVIPAKAQAKLSCRLVPGQDPKQIGLLVKNYIEALAPSGVKVCCHIHNGKGKPIRTSAQSQLVTALSASCKKVFQKSPQFIYEGASIPIIAELQEASGSQVAFFGLGLATDKIHAPNEHFGWDRIKKGFCIICDTINQLTVR